MICGSNHCSLFNGVNLRSLISVPHYLCINGRCATKPPQVEQKSNLHLIIGLSVDGLLLLLIIVGVLFKMK